MFINYRLKTCVLLSNESIKRISISFIINLSIILELCNSFTLLNVLWSLIWIPSVVSDGISNSNSIINHHFPMSLCLLTRNYYHLLWVKLEKEDLINQSSLSFILFIISTFDSVVLISPLSAAHSRVMDWSWVRSHSSVIQSFILSNTTEWHFQNELSSNWMDMREGRFFNSNDSK